MNTLDYIADSVRPAWKKPFRGEIYEYASKLNLQGGYAVKGKLDMATLQHLIEPLRAIKDPHVEVVSIIGAVQTTKSLIPDICAAYWAEHDPGDLLWLLEDDAKAKLYAERALGLLVSVPEIAAMLEGIDRMDKTKTAIKFALMKLAMCGLNPGNVQSLSWRRVIIDETWLHPFDGLIRQAMDRTKQYPNNKKILLIGQGGVEDDDHCEEHKQTDQRTLHYSCPACGAYQPFELKRQRPEGTVLKCGRPAGGTDAGLSWDTNENTCRNGRWNFEAVGDTAHHRCFYCDHRIEDRPEIRRALNDSYAYFPEGTSEQLKIDLGSSYLKTGKVPFINSAGQAAEYDGCTIPPFPKRVGFQWPGEASMRVSFRDLVVKYLRAKTAADELAYRLPLQEYYQKDRGLIWSDVIDAEYKAQTQEVYDVNEKWGEFITLIVDCQRDLEKFFYSVFASSLSGEARELARGMVASFDELAAIQQKWAIKDQHTFVDCGYQMTKVLRECVKRGHVGDIKTGTRISKRWLCWTGLKGSGRELFPHKNKVTEATEWKLYSERKHYNVNIGTSLRSKLAPWYEWSNLHCKDLLRDRRDGDPAAPKFLYLPDTLPPTDQNSHFAQMRSEKRVEEWTPRGKRSIWKLIKETRPNHEWDKSGMLIAAQAIRGIIGSPDAPEAVKGEKVEPEPEA